MQCGEQLCPWPAKKKAPACIGLLKKVQPGYRSPALTGWQGSFQPSAHGCSLQFPCVRGPGGCWTTFSADTAAACQRIGTLLLSYCQNLQSAFSSLQMPSSSTGLRNTQHSSACGLAAEAQLIAAGRNLPNLTISRMQSSIRHLDPFWLQRMSFLLGWLLAEGSCSLLLAVKALPLPTRLMGGRRPASSHYGSVMAAEKELVAELAAGRKLLQTSSSSTGANGTSATPNDALYAQQWNMQRVDVVPTWQAGFTGTQVGMRYMQSLLHMTGRQGLLEPRWSELLH